MFGKIKNVHFVGIGGIGMSGIAEVLVNLGFRVTGSDLVRSEVTYHLESLGVKVFEGHRGEQVLGTDAVVYSSAVRESNPELVEAIKRKIPVIRRAEMLGELMRMKYSIAVAGTHGKTTTTSMIGSVLSHAGFDPTIIVGGRVRSLGTNAVLGKGEFLVAEADEFDRSFLRLVPSCAVVTTLEAEHLDCYKDLDDIKNAFVEFANKVPFYGSVVVCLDEESVQSIIPRIERRMITYGVSAQADVRAEDIAFEDFSSNFRVVVDGEWSGSILLRMPGIHNVRNALAAISVGMELGISFDNISSSLNNFTGVHRRFEIKEKVRGVMIVDDYAHHPTEIEATLKGARMGKAKRIIAVFQPHLFSRTRDFCEDFGRAFFDSDILIVTDVYPAREEPIPGVSGKLVADSASRFGHRNVVYLPNRSDIAEYISGIVQEGDLVITLGAGDVYKVCEELSVTLKK